MNHIAIDKKVREILEILPKRYQTVILLRYGIDGKPKTLEEIGDNFGVTRERIRQIEVKALQDILKEKKHVLQAYVEWVSDTITKEGGIVAEHDFLDRYGQEKKGSLLLVLYLEESFLRGSGTESFHHHWYLDSRIRSNALEELEKLASHLHVRSGLMKKEEVVAHVSNLNFLKVSKVIELSPLGAYGLIDWPEVMPKGVKDKAYIVLKKEGKPLHFAEITKKINELGLNSRQALKQTVHNELIKDDRFILVGRGMYGLKEFGYKEGTVKDVLLRIFKEARRPLTKEEVIPQVLKERLVRKNTIILNLNDSGDFMCLKDGTYALKQSSKNSKLKT